MDKFKELFALSKAEVYITYNEHRGVYATVENFLDDRKRNRDLELGISEEVRAKMIEMNQMVIIQVYPDTPISFYIVYHWDIEMAIDEMIRVLKAAQK